METIDFSVMTALDTIRDECNERKHCGGCPYSCKYYVDKSVHFACVLKEIPERWQLETMEGFNDGR